MNNGLMEMVQLSQMARQGGNPRQFMAQAAQRSPRLQRAMRRINGKTPEQIFDMAEQMAQGMGVNLQEVAGRLGVQLPQKNNGLNSRAR